MISAICKPAIFFGLICGLIGCTAEAEQDKPVKREPVLETIAEVTTQSAFVRGNAAERSFETSLVGTKEDPRLAPVVELCGVAPWNYDTRYELFDMSYMDSPEKASLNAVRILVAGQGDDGSIYTEQFFVPLESLLVEMMDEPGIRIYTETEDVSGFTSGYLPDGTSDPTYEFNDIPADIQFYCADPTKAVAFIQGFKADMMSIKTASNPPTPKTYPIRYSVTFSNNGINNEGMCEYMYDEAIAVIERVLRYYNLDPILQIAEAPNNDLRLTLPEELNTDSYAKNDCRFDMSVAARWTGETLDPMPARNQNYESGYELVDQGMTQVAVSYREYMQAQESSP